MAATTFREGWEEQLSCFADIQTEHSLLAAPLMLISPEDFDLHDGGAEVSGSQGFDQ